MPEPKKQLISKRLAKALAGSSAWKDMGRSEKKFFREWFWDRNESSEYTPSRKYIKHRFKNSDLIDIADTFNTARETSSPNKTNMAWDLLAFKHNGALDNYKNTQEIFTALNDIGIDEHAPLNKSERKILRKWLISDNGPQQESPIWETKKDKTKEDQEFEEAYNQVEKITPPKDELPQTQNINTFQEYLLSAQSEEDLKNRLDIYTKNNLIWDYYNDINLNQEEFDKLSDLNLQEINPLLYNYLEQKVNRRSDIIDNSELQELREENPLEYNNKVEELKKVIQERNLGDDLTEMLLQHIEDPFNLSYYSYFFSPSEGDKLKPTGSLLSPYELQRNINIYNNLELNDPFLKNQTRFSSFIPSLIGYYLGNAEDRNYYRKSLSNLIYENEQLKPGTKKQFKNEEQINNLLQEFKMRFHGFYALNHIGLSEKEKQFLQKYYGNELFQNNIFDNLYKPQIIAKIPQHEKIISKIQTKPNIELQDLAINEEFNQNLKAGPDHKLLIKNLISYWKSIGMSEDEINKNIKEAFDKKVLKVNKEQSSILTKLLNPIDDKELISTLTPIMLKTIIPRTYDFGGFGSIREEGEAKETIQKVLRGIMRNDIQRSKKYFLSVLNAILSKSSQLNTSEINYVNELKKIVND